MSGPQVSRSAAALAGASAPQHSPDTGNQLVWVKGLVEVIVGTFFKRHRSFDRLADLGQQDDWRPGTLLA